MFIGFIVPYIPLQIIYENEFDENAKWWKCIIIIILVSAFMIIVNPFFGFGSKSANIDDLKESQKQLLKEMKN